MDQKMSTKVAHLITFVVREILKMPQIHSSGAFFK